MNIINLPLKSFTGSISNQFVFEFVLRITLIILYCWVLPKMWCITAIWVGPKKKKMHCMPLLNVQLCCYILPWMNMKFIFLVCKQLGGTTLALTSFNTTHQIFTKNSRFFICHIQALKSILNRSFLWLWNIQRYLQI